MGFQPIILWTDALLYLLVIVAVGLILVIRRHEYLRAPWRLVAHRRLAMMSLVILLLFIGIGLLDSIHFRLAKNTHSSGQTFYSTQVLSLLDVMMDPIGQVNERSYSEPFAVHAYSKSFMMDAEGRSIQGYERLQHAGVHLTDAEHRGKDILHISVWAVLQALATWIILMFAASSVIKFKERFSWLTAVSRLFSHHRIAWLEINLTTGFLLIIGFVLVKLSGHYHIFGTDKVGQDTFYAAIKSVRTGLVIGTVTTLVMLPFAILFGTMAGYFRGWIDDVIQYVYTTLSSIPGVLLISAVILSLQIYISSHADDYPTLAQRADLRLLALCVILGVTSWTGLCRLLRAETLKIREMDYVRAGVALGVSRTKIIARHIIPNVMHIVLITVVLDFSALVLAEAVLSYVGVGVDPTTLSWGNMINSARLDLAREPIVWWPLCAAFIFMFALVLSANLFADAVRDAFDPKLRHLS